MARQLANLDFIAAASKPLGALTAWQAMFDTAKLASGRRHIPYSTPHLQERRRPRHCGDLS